MANGLSVSLPVSAAAGSVDDCVLKYAPYGQPSQQAFRYWQAPRPSSGVVRFATRPGNDAAPSVEQLCAIAPRSAPRRS